MKFTLKAWDFKVKESMYLSFLIIFTQLRFPEWNVKGKKKIGGWREESCCSKNRQNCEQLFGKKATEGT